MNSDKSIERINKGIERHKNASKATRKQHLKKIFAEFQQPVQKCTSALIKELKNLAEILKEGTETSTFFLRFWINLKAVFLCNDLTSSRKGENKNSEHYNKVFTYKRESNYCEQQLILHRYSLLIHSDHNKVSVLTTIPFENKHFRSLI